MIDLAAGTGQLTRRFASIGCWVIAVEPAANMRAVLQTGTPEIMALEGTAERIPMEDAAADAVVVGNAFHHFDEDRAFAEIRRVLSPGGALALFWARSDQEDPAMITVTTEIEREVERVRSASEIVDAYRSWYEPHAVEGFTAFERRTFPTTHEIASNRVPDLYVTSSDIASLPPDVRGDLLARIAGLAASLPETLLLAEQSDVHLSFRA